MLSGLPICSCSGFTLKWGIADEGNRCLGCVSCVSRTYKCSSAVGSSCYVITPVSLRKYELCCGLMEETELQVYHPGEENKGESCAGMWCIILAEQYVFQWKPVVSLSDIETWSLPGEIMNNAECGGFRSVTAMAVPTHRTEREWRPLLPEPQKDLDFGSGSTFKGKVLLCIEKITVPHWEHCPVKVWSNQHRIGSKLSPTVVVWTLHSSEDWHWKGCIGGLQLLGLLVPLDELKLKLLLLWLSLALSVSVLTMKISVVHSFQLI